MGYKISTIIIDNLDNIQDDATILEKLGLTDFLKTGTTSFDESNSPLDYSINIGFYQNFIIINDDFRFTESFYAQKMSDIELKFCQLFPKSKILNVCCISTNYFQGYNLIENGKRLRGKTNEQDHGFSENFIPLRKYGTISKKEEALFNLNDDEFIIEIIKHVMGIEIYDYDKKDAIRDVVFNKYQNENEKFEEDDWKDEDYENINFNPNTDLEPIKSAVKKWWQFWK